MIFKIRRYSAKEAPRGPKMAPRRSRMASRLPQEGPRRPQERPKRASRKLKMAHERLTTAPRRLQKGPPEGPKMNIGPNLAQRPLWESPWTLLDPSGELPGPLWGVILGPIWTLQMVPRRAKLPGVLPPQPSSCFLLCSCAGAVAGFTRRSWMI